MSGVTVQRFCTIFEREPPTKMSICRWYKLIDQTAFAKEKALKDDQSLKLRWIQFVRLSFTVYSNQPGN
jgi:hypothetical protein